MGLRKLRGRWLSPEQRFHQSYLVNLNTGCWIWQGTRKSGLYAKITIKGVSTLAHRFSYELHHGAIPDGLFVLHKCDTPMCVNPNHLFLGTAKDNSDDKVAKNRQAMGRKHSKSIIESPRKQRGEMVRKAKLTESAVREIRSSGLPRCVLAEKFDVSATLITKVAKRKVWKHL